jgi:hypothetical protein
VLLLIFSTWDQSVIKVMKAKVSKVNKFEGQNFEGGISRIEFNNLVLILAIPIACKNLVYLLAHFKYD